MSMSTTPTPTPPLEKGAVIFLHGSGDSGPNLKLALKHYGFISEMQKLNLDVLCPTAPPRPYTMAGGMRSNVWFDRLDLSPKAPEDNAGADASFSYLASIMENLEKEQGVSAKRLYLAGFSMGGGMAMQFLSRSTSPLAGVFASGSFLAEKSLVYAQAKRPLPPILICHGEEDDLVGYAWGKATAEKLHALSLEDQKEGEGEGEDKVTFYGFPRLGHELDGRVLSVLTRWIQKDAKVFPDVKKEQENGQIVKVLLAKRGGGGGGRGAGACTNDDLPEVRMTVEAEGAADTDTHTHRATFWIPVERMESFVGGADGSNSKPVATRGGLFTFTAGGEPGTIVTVFESPRPQETAAALLEKVKHRLQDPDAPQGLSACQPS